jgi:hypothetical protein
LVDSIARHRRVLGDRRGLLTEDLRHLEELQTEYQVHLEVNVGWPEEAIDCDHSAACGPTEERRESIGHPEDSSFDLACLCRIEISLKAVERDLNAHI